MKIYVTNLNIYSSENISNPYKIHVTHKNKVRFFTVFDYVLALLTPDIVLRLRLVSGIRVSKLFFI